MSTEKNKPNPPDPSGVPSAVVSRLSFYLRELQLLLQAGRETTSSSQLGTLLGYTDAQVRKDLAYFGQFGHPGIGYRTAELIDAIRRILGTDQTWTVALAGVGNLGRALLGYRGFGRQGFRMVAAFDTDQQKVGSRIDQVPIYHLDDLATIVRREQYRLGMLAVPADEAQAVADQFVAAGIEGIVNFAPITISLPPGISQVGVDLAMELEQLAFSVVNRPGDR